MQLNVTSIQLNDPISELDNSRFASKFKSSLSLSKTNTTIYSILSFSLTCLACSCLWLCIPLSPYFFYYWWSRLSFFLSFFYLFILNFSLFMLSIYPFFLSIYLSFLSIYPFFLSILSFYLSFLSINLSFISFYTFFPLFTSFFLLRLQPATLKRVFQFATRPSLRSALDAFCPKVSKTSFNYNDSL